MVDVRLLSDAVTALETLTKGLAPDSLHALAGGFALDCLSYEKTLGDLLTKDLAEAAQGLFRVARGDPWKLKVHDRERLMDLVASVREIIEFATDTSSTLH